MSHQFDRPLISVIITTYNHGNYLPIAIRSVQKQNYPKVELVVIDDGSTDDTKTILANYTGIKYYFQENKGLSAARNTGIEKSGGDFLVFLDADDWLENDALEKNAAALEAREECAFVSGNYFLLRAGNDKAMAVATKVDSYHYEKFLEYNYIGMHAAVMYRRAVLEKFRFDEDLKSCEDYDLYLRIARHHPVFHHAPFIATYYFHDKGLSHNYQVMIDSIQKVIDKQLPFLKNAHERKAFRKGKNQWQQYYCLQYYKTYRSQKAFSVFKNKQALAIFLRYDFQLLITMLTNDVKKIFA